MSDRRFGLPSLDHWVRQRRFVAWFVVMLYRLHMGPIGVVHAVPVNSPATESLP